MLENIKEQMKMWDWKTQAVGEGENEIPIARLISRIERGHYKTKKIKMDLTVTDLTGYIFSCTDVFDFMVHYKLVEDADLSYPIIINQTGHVIDGRHRMCKAILRGDKKIDAIMILDNNVV